MENLIFAAYYLKRKWVRWVSNWFLVSAVAETSSKAYEESYRKQILWYQIFIQAKVLSIHYIFQTSSYSDRAPYYHSNFEHSFFVKIASFIKRKKLEKGTETRWAKKVTKQNDDKSFVQKQLIVFQGFSLFHFQFLNIIIT